MAAPSRHRLIEGALARLLPATPPYDRSAILDHALSSPGLRKASPETAAWLSAAAHIRHVHTDYQALLDDDYGVEAARHFTLEPINQVLAAWGGRRRLTAAEDDPATGQKDVDY